MDPESTYLDILSERCRRHCKEKCGVSGEGGTAAPRAAGLLTAEHVLNGNYRIT